MLGYPFYGNYHLGFSGFRVWGAGSDSREPSTRISGLRGLGFGVGFMVQGPTAGLQLSGCSANSRYLEQRKP